MTCEAALDGRRGSATGLRGVAAAGVGVVGVALLAAGAAAESSGGMGDWPEAIGCEVGSGGSLSG